MKNTFTHNDHHIGIKVINGLPHFCAADIGRACGYKSSLPLKGSDKAIKSGAFNYVSLYKLPAVLGRASGARREITQDLLDRIEREFIAIMPAPVQQIPPPPVDTEFELKLKRKQIETEYLKQKSELAEQQTLIFRAQSSMAQSEMKLIELERQLAEMRVANLIEFPSLRESTNG